MERIKDIISEHKKLYIGLSVLVAIALSCLVLHFVFYAISDISDRLPYADIGDLFAFIAFYIGLFIGILIVGSLLWLIATKVGSRLRTCWYILIVNTIIVAFDIYIIIDDLLISYGWFQGLATVLICMCVVPVNIAVYIFCIVRLRMHAKKLKSKQEQNE